MFDSCLELISLFRFVTVEKKKIANKTGPYAGSLNTLADMEEAKKEKKEVLDGRAAKKVKEAEAAEARRKFRLQQQEEQRGK